MKGVSEMRGFQALWAIALGILTGCAGIKVEPNTSESAGIRYCQSSPYLLVTTDNDGGIKTELLFLPDCSRKMSARPYSVLAKNDTTLEFENGVLRTGESEADTAIVPKAVLSALEKVATTAFAAAAANAPAATEPRRVPGPILFRIELNCDGCNKVRLIGPNGTVAEGSTTDIYVKDSPAPTIPQTAPASGGGR
jgi:hypothetical protein